MSFPDVWGVKKGNFPHNLQKLSGEKEIARSILNNGFFTIAHNFSSDDRTKFINLFKKLKASKKFLDELDDMFNYKVDYEDPRTNPGFGSSFGWGSGQDDYMGEDEIQEGAWENMSHSASLLDKMARKEKIYDKLAKMINW